MNKERLRQVMQKRGHNPESLSEIADVAERTIWRLLQEGKGTSDETAARLAVALGVSVDYLLGISDISTPGLRLDNLTDEEREILAALRRGEPLEAIRVIAAKH